MFAYKRLLALSIILFVYGADCKGSSKPVPSFPRLDEFFKKKSTFRKRYKLGRCDVELRQEECLYTAISKKGHCLIFRSLLEDLIPQYSIVLENSELKSFQNLPVTEFSVDTCGQKISFRTTAEAKFEIVPEILHLASVEADISVPVPIADFDIFGDGVWLLPDYQMKVKFNKIGLGQYNVKGAAETEFTPVRQISSKFHLDILPTGAIGAILRKLDLEDMLMRNCKMYGSVQMYSKNYQLLFSGSPDRKEFSGGNIRMLVSSSGGSKNLGFLLELQDYSPVTLLKKIYGPAIQRVSILRDRNQTIALYVSPKPTENFTNIVSSHGTSRWIHMGSKFEAGATLLVTLPFPKRKALDMKVQLFTDGLGFSLPENEKLFGDLALGAISPSQIVRLDQGDNRLFGVPRGDSLYSKIRILKFRYFIQNDTYLAAAENLASIEEELSELMPKGNPLEKVLSIRESTGAQRTDKLDAFFKRESKDNTKRNVERTTSSSNQGSLPPGNGAEAVTTVTDGAKDFTAVTAVTEDALQLAEKLGLLK